VALQLQRHLQCRAAACLADVAMMHSNHRIPQEAPSMSSSTMDSIQLTDRLEHVVLVSPLLLERPVVGSGVYAVSARHLIESELRSLNTAFDLRIAASLGWALVGYDAELVRLEQVLKAFEAAGYPVINWEPLPHTKQIP